MDVALDGGSHMWLILMLYVDMFNLYHSINIKWKAKNDLNRAFTNWMNVSWSPQRGKWNPGELSWTW